MAVQPQEAAIRRHRLFYPRPPQLGWEFRDRWRSYRPFPHPEPTPPPMPAALLERQRRAALVLLDRREDAKRWGLSSGGCLVLGLVFSWSGTAGAVARLLVVLGLVGTSIVGVRLLIARWTNSSLDGRVATAGQQVHADHERRLAAWQAAKWAHERAEQQRVNALADYSAVCLSAGCHRLDLFGGSPDSWSAFLVVHGTSLLTAGPLVVVDLTRAGVCHELAVEAGAAGVSTDVQVFRPAQLPVSDLLLGFEPEELVDLLVEAVHGRDPGAARHERLADRRTLKAVVSALGDDVSLKRIVAGLRVLANEPDHELILLPGERTRIADEVMSVENRQRAGAGIARLIDHLEPLEDLGAQAAGGRAVRLDCLVLGDAHTGSPGETLAELLVRAVSHRVSRSASGRPTSLVLAGADRLHLDHLEQLATTCRRSGVHLVLLFEHLRDAGTALAGGAVGFMRLKGHREAQAAADHVGKDHRFLVSQFTRTLGGSRTMTTGESEGWSSSSGVSATEGTSWSTGSNTGISHTTQENAPLGRGTTTRSAGSSRTTGGSRSTTTSRTTGRSGSVSRSEADGENWSDAASVQRVHEHVVDPTEFQRLDDHLMLLVEHRGGRREVRSVEFPLELLDLPRVAMTPFPDHPGLPLPAPALPLLTDGGTGAHRGAAHPYDDPEGVFRA
ncbi:hypothetical protein FHS29_007369 [Saccharothrix tamanrassetensis]|uniref:Uncharacterized protein n=1 Tax=Saccharothrix tamanrassetensis TaxID=1051531 RepID=A0A841CSH8_9PSEU|nr:hypothetical protein [Saccharothrix tamanrassetensis]MBB5960741.1 hypothetical protein [Saccharothrix tamanrassetensis]